MGNKRIKIDGHASSSFVSYGGFVIPTDLYLSIQADRKAHGLPVLKCSKVITERAKAQSNAAPGTKHHEGFLFSRGW